MEFLKGFSFDIQRFATELSLAWGKSADNATVVASTAKSIVNLGNVPAGATWYIYSDKADFTSAPTSITAYNATKTSQALVGTVTLNNNGQYSFDFSDGLLAGTQPATALTYSGLKLAATTQTLAVGTGIVYDDGTTTNITAQTGLVLGVTAANTASSEVVKAATSMSLTTGSSWIFDTDDSVAVTASDSTTAITVKGAMTVNDAALTTPGTGAITGMTDGSVVTELPANATAASANVDGETIKVNGATYVQSGTDAAIIVTATSTTASKLTSGLVTIDATNTSDADNSVITNTPATIAVSAGKAVVNGATNEVTKAISGTVITGVPTNTNVSLISTAVDGSTIQVDGGVTYVQSGTTSLVLGSVGNDSYVITGLVKVTTTNDTAYVGAAGQTSFNTANIEVVKVISGDGVVASGGAVASNTITSLNKGDKFTVTAGNDATQSVTYEVIDNNSLAVTDTKTGTTNYYSTTGSLTTATINAETQGTNFTELDIKGAGTPVLMAPKDITVKDVTTTKYFTALGQEFSEENDNTIVKVEGGSNPKTVTVNSSMDSTRKIDLSGTSATVTDKGTTTKYATDKATFTATGATFTSNDSVISGATGGTFVLSAAGNEFTVAGAAKIDASALVAGTSGKVTFKAGTNVEGAEVALTASKSFQLTETNNGANAVDTVYDASTGTLVGVDGDATIKTTGVTGAATDLASVATTGDGTFTVGKTSYTVAGDSDGVVFKFTNGGGTLTDTIGEIAKLDREATVAISSKLSNVDLTVGAAAAGGANTAFTSINAKNGATFTSTDTSGAATITLFAKGDSVKTATITNGVEVVAVGGNSDGIVIGANSLAALNDGDKVKVFTGTDTYYLYEVSGTTMVVSDYTTTGGKFKSSTTYTLSDSTDPGFTVGTANGGTQINGDKGQGTAVTFGTSGDTKTQSTLTDGIYINADGTETTDSNKAVAKVSVQDDVVTYASQSSKGQVVQVGAADKNEWNITTGAGRDTISVMNDGNATIDGGAGDDGITIAGKGDKVVNTGDGKNSVTVDGGGDVTLTLGTGKDTVTVNASNTGDLVINATAGNNEIDLSLKTKGDVSVTGGSGNDTIIASSADDVISGGDGKDVFYVGKGIKVNDYNFDNDVIYTNGSAFTVTDEGKVSTANGAADISATAGDFYAAQIKTGTGKAANWAWAKDGGSTIDITSYTKDAYLQGDADGASALYAGSGDDVITAKSDNDSVFGGAGKNTINLGSGEKRVVGMSSAAHAKDTVSGFKASFEDEGDSIFMVDGSIASVVVDTVSGSAADLTIKSDGSSVSLTGAGVSTVTGAVELKIAGAKAAVIASGATATVESADYADAYVGKDSAVNFSKVDGDLYVDLSNGLTASGNGAKFVGITAVTGGTGVNTLMGSAKADYIVAGTGKSSLYGGAGADTLVGNGEADMFFIGEGTNTNTITKFMASGSETSDTVKILGDVTNAKLNGSTIVLGTADGSKAVIQNLSTGSINANTMVNVEANNFTGVAKLGESGKANNFTYDKSVGYYGGGSQVDKVSVASGFSDNAEVWLDGSKGTAFGSVDQVDFRNGTGNYILAGDSSKNTIVGGKGDSSLWGGAGSSADSVVGTAGGTTKFFYGIGEGNDTLVAGSSNDNVNLYNIKVSDLTGYEITGSGVKLTTTTGDNVFVNTGNKNISFTLSDGSTYTANQSTKSWE